LRPSIDLTSIQVKFLNKCQPAPKPSNALKKA
jgi:hypothetical protein